MQAPPGSREFALVRRVIQVLPYQHARALQQWLRAFLEHSGEHSSQGGAFEHIRLNPAALRCSLPPTDSPRCVDACSTCAWVLAYQVAMSEDTLTPGNVVLRHHLAAIKQEQQQQLQHHTLTAPQADAPVQQQQQHKFPAQQYAAAGSLWPPAGPGMTQPHLPQAAGLRGGTAGLSDRHASSPAQRQHAMHLPLPAAYSRLSVAGDTVADAQRQTDQGLGPSGAAAGGTPGGHQQQQQQQQAAATAAWAMQRGAAGQHSCWPPAGPAGHEVDAAKLRAQADQHIQAPALSVEVGAAKSIAAV